MSGFTEVSPLGTPISRSALSTFPGTQIERLAREKHQRANREIGVPSGLHIYALTTTRAPGVAGVNLPVSTSPRKLGMEKIFFRVVAVSSPCLCCFLAPDGAVDL